MADELVCVVDENDKLIENKMKSICHQDGLWHRVSANLIFNSEGKLWLQTRAKGKIGEGLLDYSASGHAGVNESYEDAAKKELEEELGIKTPLTLKYKKLLESFEDEIGSIRHIINVYSGEHNGPFIIQESELESVDLYNLGSVKEILLNHPERMTEGLKLALIKYFNENIYKKDFPIFDNHPDLVYLDSAATSQRPKQIIKSITNFYEKENANIHRGVYTLSEQATTKYNEARKKVANFLNADEKEIVFTRNTTESINILSNRIKPLIKEGKDEILLTEMEHHSNLVPWQQFAKENNFKLKFIQITDNYELDYEKAKELINEKTALLSVTHISNVLGTINDIKLLIDLAKEKNTLTIIDAAQSIQHVKIDVQELDCDFLVFSSHKMLGPTGIGILYGKKPHLDNMEPLFFGGGMISSVSYEESTWSDLPEKFEAGTQNIAESIALGAAIDYIEKIGFNKIQEHESDLTNYALKELGKLENIEIYNPGANKSSAIISFNLKGIHPHDVAEILNDNDIAIRAGHHCCMPLMKKLNLQGTCRASFSIYNNKEDIDKLVKGLKKCQEVFR